MVSAVGMLEPGRGLEPNPAANLMERVENACLKP